MMFNNSLKMIKIDQNTLESWQIVCKKYNFIVSEYVDFIVWIVTIQFGFVNKLAYASELYLWFAKFEFLSGHLLFLSPHLNFRIVP
jgi:hypothetical protein